MRKYITIITIVATITMFWGFTATAQKQADTEVCCFAKLEFKQDQVWLFIPDLSYNIKLLPKPQRGLMVSSSLRGPFCHTNEDFQAEIQRIKQIILHSDISKANTLEQEIYLKQLLLVIIWPHFFEVETSVIESKVKDLEGVITQENQQSLNIVINLHQSFDSDK